MFHISSPTFPPNIPSGPQSSGLKGEANEQVHRKVEQADTTGPSHERRTCESMKYAIDDNGMPCIDLKRKLSSSKIYMVQTPEVQYLACTIPKTGCTIQNSLMTRILGIPNYESSATAHNSSRKHDRCLSALDNPTIARILANESIPKYMILRNPIDRMLSAYLSKIEAHMEDPSFGKANFSEWIYEHFPKGTSATNRSWNGVNPHWIPQMEFCGLRVREVASYFRKFRFEERESFVDYLYTIIPEKYLKDGWRRRENLSFRDHVLAPGSKTKGTHEKLLSYFTLDLYNHMAAYLEQEIKFLGYKEDVRKARQYLEMAE